jgi:hypothetical protein
LQSAGEQQSSQPRKLKRLASKSENLISQNNKSRTGDSPGKSASKENSVDREYEINKTKLEKFASTLHQKNPYVPLESKSDEEQNAARP